MGETGRNDVDILNENNSYIETISFYIDKNNKPTMRSFVRNGVNVGDIIDPNYLKSLYEGENFEVKVKKYFEDNPAPSDGK